jgi:hypothetical protein
MKVGEKVQRVSGGTVEIGFGHLLCKCPKYEGNWHVTFDGEHRPWRCVPGNQLQPIEEKVEPGNAFAAEPVLTRLADLEVGLAELEARFNALLPKPEPEEGDNLRHCNQKKEDREYRAFRW